MFEKKEVKVQVMNKCENKVWPVKNLIRLKELANIIDKLREPNQKYRVKRKIKKKIFP